MVLSFCCVWKQHFYQSDGILWTNMNILGCTKVWMCVWYEHSMEYHNVDKLLLSIERRFFIFTPLFMFSVSLCLIRYSIVTDMVLVILFSFVRYSDIIFGYRIQCHTLNEGRYFNILSIYMNNYVVNKEVGKVHMTLSQLENLLTSGQLYWHLINFN